jgi:azurin
MTGLLLLFPLLLSAPAAPAMPAQAAARAIEIQTGDNMRFTPSRIEAKPGESLRVVLKNAGTLPKLAMAHNFVLLKPGVNAKTFAAKCENARATEFIAPEVKDQILASTTLVGPGETAEVTFAAPAKPGTYTFICTFTGHFNLGMAGTLVVK